MQYSILSQDGESFVTVLVSGHDPFVAGDDHPNYSQIIDHVLFGHHSDDDDYLIGLFDVAKTAGDKFARISERVSANHGHIYLDGDEINNALTTQILRFMEADQDFGPLVKFFENVQANPNEHSREQLYVWLDRRDFTITHDGMIVAYKGTSFGNDGEYRSISSGTATVNGEVHHGQIPQRNGDIVEMPRSEVQHNPRVGCHTGLHVGTYEYASGFSHGALLEVHVNPRDVVNVPTDCEAQKMRVCRYQVVDIIDKPYSAPVLEQEVYTSYFGRKYVKTGVTRMPRQGDVYLNGDIAQHCYRDHVEGTPFPILMLLEDLDDSNYDDESEFLCDLCEDDPDQCECD